LTDNAKQQALDLDTMEPSAQLPAPVAPRQEPKAAIAPDLSKHADSPPGLVNDESSSDDESTEGSEYRGGAKEYRGGANKGGKKRALNFDAMERSAKLPKLMVAPLAAKAAIAPAKEAAGFLTPTKSKDSGDDVLAGFFAAMPVPLQHADSPPSPTNEDESPTDDESAKAEFMREIAKGPENVAAISAVLRHKKLKKHYVFVCRCPFCIRAGLKHASTTRLRKKPYRTS
jgi:hypothetical protein